MRWTLVRFTLVALLLALPLASHNIIGPSLLLAADKAEPLDINTATAEELKALPEVGDAYSEIILKHRPYKRKDELVQRR